MLRHKICWQIVQWIPKVKQGTQRSSLEKPSRALSLFLFLSLLVLHIPISEAFASWSGRYLLNAPINIPTCSAPVQVISMDLDDDGDADLAVRCEIVEKLGEVIEGSGELLLFENIGDGDWMFKRKIGLPSNIQVPTYLGPAYLKSAMFMTGAPEIAPGAFDMHITDVNGDGLLDLIQVVRELWNLKVR